MVQRSPNSHTLKKRAFPCVARPRREQPFKSADDAELKAAADVIAGGSDRWYSWAVWGPADVGYKLIGFSAQAEADAMQRWIEDSGIETRPSAGGYDGPMLTLARRQVVLMSAPDCRQPCR